MFRFLLSLSLVVLIQYVDVPFERLRSPEQGCVGYPLVMEKIMCLEGCYQTFYLDV